MELGGPNPPANGRGVGQMAFRPNYRFERNERDRQKKAKAEEKLRRQQEKNSQRRDPDPPEPVEEPTSRG